MKIRTREDLIVFVEQATKNGWSYFNARWEPKLWDMSQDKIIASLVYRFIHTQDRQEYYGIMPYLKGILHNDLLYTLYDDRYTPTEFEAERQYLDNPKKLLKQKTKLGNTIWTNNLESVEGLY